jgi:predicted HicB family RNase H-like nuclease
MAITKTEILSFRVGPELRATLTELAVGREMSLGEYVRYLLAKHVDEARGR